MNLATVREWAARRGVAESRFDQISVDALMMTVTRLLNADRRETSGRRTALVEEEPGRSFLVTGTELRIPVAAFPFGHAEPRGLPERRGPGGEFVPVRSPDSFIEELSCVWREAYSPDSLKSDFRNSIANLALNQVLWETRDSGAPIAEAAYGGHSHYPFPALREGVSIDEIAAFSNIRAQPARLRLVALASHRYVSVDYADEVRLAEAWSGRPGLPTGVIPLHPWQSNSDVVVAARLAGLAELLDQTVEATALASQRTCRLSSGYDVKLAIDVTVTGERRLLYPANSLNAPAVSALVRAQQLSDETPAMAFQRDVATIAHSDPLVGTHLAAIIREPVAYAPSDDELVIPALALWMPPRLADHIWQIDKASEAVELFRRYCDVIMRGPIVAYANWGLAFEPHLQNSLIMLRGNQVERLILRDLDATMLDRRRIPKRLKSLQLRFPVDPWSAMPSWEDSGRRLLHSLFLAHLAPVISYFVERTGIEAVALTRCIDDVWLSLVGSARGDRGLKIRELRALGEPVKMQLGVRMARQMELSWLPEDCASGLSGRA